MKNEKITKVDVLEFKSFFDETLGISRQAISEDLPKIEAVDGICYDFNRGFRIMFPDTLTGQYRLRLSNSETGNDIYEGDIQNGSLVRYDRYYYIPYYFEIYKDGGKTPIFTHEFNLENKEVACVFGSDGLGDTISWIGYIDKFQTKYKCKLTAVMEQKFIDVLEKQYPNIEFRPFYTEIDTNFYASFIIGLDRSETRITDEAPYSTLNMGIHRHLGYKLNVDTEETPPKFDLSAPRKIKDRYVCIATHASMQAKYWNNPTGWRDVVKFLKDSGYRVLCIDGYTDSRYKGVCNVIPYGVEDFTGHKPLQERIDLIKDADFFVGLSSGLSWFAWGCRVPVVLISGFTNPVTEFYTPYRVINTEVCNSCWDDPFTHFTTEDFFCCPRQQNEEYKYCCSKQISSTHVINTIKRIPAFQEFQKQRGV